MISHTAEANAVVSDIFLGGAGVPYSSGYQGNCVTHYGSAGYALCKTTHAQPDRAAVEYLVSTGVS